MIILAKTYLKFQEEMLKDENKDKQVQLILKHFYNIDDYTKLKYDDVEQKVTYISNILNELYEEIYGGGGYTSPLEEIN